MGDSRPYKLLGHTVSYPVDKDEVLREAAKLIRAIPDPSENFGVHWFRLGVNRAADLIDPDIKKSSGIKK